LIKRDTRRYAKRQMTWFNADKEIKWVEYSDNFASICRNVIEFFAVAAIVFVITIIATSWRGGT